MTTVQAIREFLADPQPSSAAISLCGTFRYCLKRVWDPALPLLVFIMLNPSTADASMDDPTIRRCTGFARSNGYGGIIVVNLFAFRSPSPDAMKRAEDPVGPDNDTWLQSVFEHSITTGGEAIAAWGVHGQFLDRDYNVAERAEITGLPMKCLGKTKGGDPRHPLYVKGDQAFEPLRSVV